LIVVGLFSYCILNCPLFLLADNIELIVEDEFDTLRFNVERLLFDSWLLLLLFAWLTVRCGCWLTATRITCCCCCVILGTDWRSNEDVVVAVDDGLLVSIGNDDDDGKRCCCCCCWDVSVDTLREILCGDVRLIEFVLLLLLTNDENEIHISVLGKRSVHLLNKI